MPSVHWQSFICMLLFCTAPVFAQYASTHDYAAKELQQHFKNVAAAYEIEVDGKKTTLHPQPLINWQNPARRQEQGALRVWTINGRPRVLGSMFTFGHDGNTFCRHEMISLASTPLTAELDGDQIWAPTKAGITWVPVESAESGGAPAESPARRLFQMRSLARQFSGTMHDPYLPTEQLTLIPQPVMRYAAPRENIVDGGIFSLAVSTDPEIFLLIEAVEAEGKKSWQYGAVRAHYNRVVLKRNDEVVWEAPTTLEQQATRAGDKPWMFEPYFTFFETTALPDPEDLR